MFVAAAILSLIVCGVASAQSDTAGKTQSERPDTAIDLLWPRDPNSLSRCADAAKKSFESVYLRASIADSDRTALTAQTDFMAQEVAESMRTRMGGSPDSMANGDGVVRAGSVPAELVVVAHPDGSVQRHATSMTGDTTATVLLTKAFDAARADGDAMLIWPDGYSADSIIVRLALHALPVKREGSMAVQYRAHPAFGVFRMSYYIETPALAKPNNPDPVYPFTDRLHRVGGTLMLRFVVDTNGRAVPETIRDVWPPDTPKLTGELLRYYQGFVDASRRAVATWKFSPARIGDCPVRQIVQLPIQYKYGSQ